MSDFHAALEILAGIVSQYQAASEKLSAVFMQLSKVVCSFYQL
jgi:hypothetical protein